MKMDEETFKTHLNSLKEMILDEEKLITYVSISKEFCIHVNESKSLMNEVVQEIKKKQPDTVLNVIYVLSGLAEDGKAYTYVCSENEITEYHKRFKNVFFEHIYSINKGNPSVDKVAFMAITKFEDYHLCSGLIKSNLCSKRTADEIGNLKSHSVVSISDQQPKPLAKKIKDEKSNDVIINGHGDTKVPEVKPEPVKQPFKQEKTSPKKENSTNKQKQEVKKGNKPQKGISGFFSRSDSATAKKITKKTKSKESEFKVKLEAEDTNKNNKVEEMDVDDDNIVSEPKKTKVDKNEGKPATNNGSNIESKDTSKNKSKPNTKSLTQIKKNAKVDKKRKRVLHVSDSDSDEEKNDPFVDDDDVHNQQINMDSEDEIPPTPAINTIKITSAMLNPKKKRKIVNKTYTDEDGYVLTRKEEVYESLSESEEITEIKENIIITETKKVNEVAPKEKSECVKTEVSPKGKKNGTTKNKRKKSSPQQGKQASIMSFFKKT